MKNRKKKEASTAVHSRRFSVTMVTVAAILIAVAAITVVSKQLVGNQPAAPAVTKAVTSTETGKKYVTVKVAGRDVQVDPQTGQIKPLSQEDAKQMAEGLKKLLNKSTDDLVRVQNPDGSTSIDLQGRFRNVAVARINADGTLEQSCIDEPLQAARFFGIDPKLLGVEPAKGETAQPVIRTPATKVAQ